MITFRGFTHMLSMFKEALQLLLLLLLSHTWHGVPTYSHVTHILTAWCRSIPGLAVVEGWRSPRTPGPAASRRHCRWNDRMRGSATAWLSDEDEDEDEGRVCCPWCVCVCVCVRHLLSEWSLLANMFANMSWSFTGLSTLLKKLSGNWP